MRKIIFILTFPIILTLLTGCFLQKDMHEVREAFAQNSTSEIVIGIPGPISLMKEETGFHNGVMIAVNEINEEGGINGRFIEARFVDDKRTFNDGIRVAQELASQEEVVAVIGHWNTFITLPAARIYNDAGLLMLSPIVSNTDLTKQGYKYVFQNIINDYEIGKQMAEYARAKGYQRIVVLYADNDYGRGLSRIFEKYISDDGGMVVDRKTDFINQHEFNMAYDRWVAFNYDAVFIADSMGKARDFINKIREKDSQIPIFAGDSLDIGDIQSVLGDNSEGLVIATIYNPENIDQGQLDFIKTYKNEYYEEPDAWAIQGYDSIKLLADAMRKAESVSPKEVAEILHNKENWQGVLGHVTFNQYGELIGRNIYKKTIRNGEVEFLEN